MLASAMVQAAEGQQDDARMSLKRARYGIHEVIQNRQALSAWYRLDEACELLFESTGHIAYRDLAYELARIYQRVSPLDAWSYAVDAKYSRDETGRRRALGIALYLDPRSYHLTGIFQKEKDRAREWFEKLNPSKIVRKEKTVRPNVLPLHHATAMLH